MQKFVRVGVGVCVFKDGRILLGKRQKSSAEGAGTWSPPGGKLDFGEKYFDCARRETLEEAGIQISNLKFITVTNDMFAKDHYITIYVRADWKSGVPKALEPNKMAEWDWFDWNNMPNNLFMPFENLLKTGFKS